MNIPADITELWESLAISEVGKIVYMFLDDVDGLSDRFKLKAVCFEKMEETECVLNDGLA